MTQEHTHVVILAAGHGRRLGSLSEATPKWLLEVGSQTIAERHLDAVAGGENVASVRVVTGHASTVITRFLAEREESVESIFNVDYSRRNNWFSLLLALRSIGEVNARVVVINSDLCAAPPWIRAFVNQCAATDAEALIATDIERPLTEESMKVSATANGALSKIGKTDVDEPIGEYVGMLMARGAVLKDLRETLESFVSQSDADDEWYERAVALTADSGAEWVLWPTPDSRWVEIDDQADYELALELIA